MDVGERFDKRSYDSSVESSLRLKIRENNSSSSRSCGFSVCDFSFLHSSRALIAPSTVFSCSLEDSKGVASCSDGGAGSGWDRRNRKFVRVLWRFGVLGRTKTFKRVLGFIKAHNIVNGLNSVSSYKVSISFFYISIVLV